MELGTLRCATPPAGPQRSMSSDCTSQSAPLIATASATGAATLQMADCDCPSLPGAAADAAAVSADDASSSLLASLQQRYFAGYPLRLAAHPDKGRFVVATSVSEQRALRFNSTRLKR